MIVTRTTNTLSIASGATGSFPLTRMNSANDPSKSWTIDSHAKIHFVSATAIKAALASGGAASAAFAWNNVAVVAGQNNFDVEGVVVSIPTTATALNVQNNTGATQLVTVSYGRAVGM